MSSMDVRYKNSQDFQCKIPKIFNQSLDHLIATDLDTGQTFQLYSSRQETRQRLSLSLAEITSMLDQTKEQVETLRNAL